MEAEIITFEYLEALLHFVYSIMLIFCLSYFLYYKRGGKPEFILVFLGVGAVVFQFCLLLKSTTLSLGLAFGLFALFTLIRFRSRRIEIREMVYLFASVGIAALDGLIGEGPFYQYIVWDLLIILVLYFGEFLNKQLKHTFKLITFEKLELLEEGNYHALLDNLSKRLSMKHISKVEVGKVDFKRNSAELKVFYKEEKP